jgi:hypothetical protein
VENAVYEPGAAEAASVSPLEAREILKAFTGGHLDGKGRKYDSVRGLSVADKKLIIACDGRADIQLPLESLVVRYGAVTSRGASDVLETLKLEEYELYRYRNGQTWAPKLAQAIYALKEEARRGGDAVAEAAAERARAAQQQADFEKVSRAYREAAIKPEIPEETRRFKIKAETAVEEKRFRDAADLYARGLALSPWWPEGRYNRALVLAETRDYAGAVAEMKRYLVLAPGSPGARTAQDKIYAWEDKVP